ncbi:MAG TPA: hypothetical protein ENH85_16015 [Candidatus Scalindua sp.]|nr:hypothetical protein [Candidatus Scalindua sp.]
MHGIGMFLHLLKNKWSDPLGLVAAEAFGALMLAAVLPNSGLEELLKKKHWFVFYLVLAGVILALWLYSRKHLPKNKRGRIGITIAVYSETRKDEMRIKSDFLREFRSAIVSQFSGKVFQILVLNNHRSQEVQTRDDARQISDDMRSHCVIWGSFRRRQLHGRATCALNLHCLVRHRPIPLNHSNQLSREFTKLFPPKILFLAAEELPGFEITTDMLQEATIYIVGVAALVSGDISLALKLHEHLYATIRHERHPERTTHFNLLKSGLRGRLADEYILAARFHYESKDYRDLAKVKDYARKARDMNFGNCISHVLLAICSFYKKDIPGSLREVLRAKQIAPRDGAVLYSEAFIYYYSRKYWKADKTYGKAIKTQTPSPTVLEVELFITDLIEREPDRTDFYYPLGLINYYAKQDYKLATNYFRQFVDEYRDCPDLTEQVKKARIHLDELQSKSSSNK